MVYSATRYWGGYYWGIILKNEDDGMLGCYILPSVTQTRGSYHDRDKARLICFAIKVCKGGHARCRRPAGRLLQASWLLLAPVQPC